MFNTYLVNKNNLIHNIKQAIEINPYTKVCAMVKADAYGVGVDGVVPLLNDYVDFFGVACFFEAKKIKNLTNKKILIVGPLERNDIDIDFSYTCSNVDDVKFLMSLNRKIFIHLKVNTGMNRFGFSSLPILFVVTLPANVFDIS